MRSHCVIGLFLFFGLGLITKGFAQHIYLKHPEKDFVKSFSNPNYRVAIMNPDSNAILEHQYAYLLRFYPNLLLKNITVKFIKSKHPVKVNPRFSSIFKAPGQREYKVFYSKTTSSTMDSVLLNNLNFNSQLGLISIQLSMIEDLSTGGFFNFLYWYARNWSKKGRRKIYHDAEHQSLELGLGYQLYDYNTEFFRRLQIENWQNTKGYSTYMNHYRNLPMKPALILNLISDLPVYMSNSYK
jgi:hypothetical protein